MPRTVSSRDRGNPIHTYQDGVQTLKSHGIHTNTREISKARILQSPQALWPAVGRQERLWGTYWNFITAGFLLRDRIKNRVPHNSQMVIKIHSLFFSCFRVCHSGIKNTYEWGGEKALNSFPGIFPSLEGHITWDGIISVSSCLSFRELCVSGSMLRKGLLLRVNFVPKVSPFYFPGSERSYVIPF